jgi:sigma-B regulation protein RsbU (phosphoserine phosphatase)
VSAKTEIENYLATGMEPADVIASANRRLCANNDAGMFVTVWAATLDWQTGLVTYVNAGHNFPLVRRGRSGSWEWLKKRCGLFLGTFETAKYREEHVTLEKGDELFLYTDGVNEAFSVTEEQYGDDRLEEFLSAHADLHPHALVDAMRSELQAWAEGAEQSDDITMLSIEYGAHPEATGSITLEATTENLTAALNLVRSELASRYCPITVQHKVDVALEELYVNVCTHAYAEQGEPGKVRVDYVFNANPTSITVSLTDWGPAFNPLSHDDPSAPTSIDETPIGGLGLLMVKKSTDDLSYLRDGDANVVVFRCSW